MDKKKRVISAGLVAMLVLVFAYLGKLSVAAVAVLWKVGWGDYSLVYMRESSFEIFLAYASVVALVSAIYWRVYAGRFAVLVFIASVSALLAAVLMAASSVIGFSG